MSCDLKGKQLAAATVTEREIASAAIGTGLTGGSGSVIDVDLNELATEATFDPAADFVPMVDATDSGSDKALWSVIATAIAGNGLVASSGVLAFDISELTGAVFDPAADSLPFSDATDSGAKVDLWSDIAALIAGVGIAASAGVLAADLNELPTEGTFAPSADFVAIVDATDAGSDKSLWSTIAAAVAGVGLAAAAGVFAVDLNELSTEATFDPAADFLPMVDATDSGSDKTLWSTIGTAIAGVGLAASSGVLAVDLNELTAAAIDVAADSFPFIDATDSGTKQESIADLATAQAGAGLTATAGVFDVGAGTGIAVAADSVAVDTASTVSFSGAAWDFPADELTVGTPTVAGAAANKAYVDGVAQGLDVKLSVRAALSSLLEDDADISGTPVYDPDGGTSGNGQITGTLAVSGTLGIDGVDLNDGDRILLMGEGTGTAEVHSIDTVADIAGSLNSTYFIFYASPTIAYYVWYNASGAGVDPAPSAPAGVEYRGIEVAITNGDSAAVVASLTETAIDAADQSAIGGTLDVTLEVAPDGLTIINPQGGQVTDIAEGSAPTTFALSVDTQGTGLGIQANWIGEVTIAGTSLTINLAEDFDADSEVTANAFTFVEEGTTYQDTGWTLSSNDPILVGQDALIWAQFSSAGIKQGGAGITENGNVFDVTNATNGGLQVNADDLQLDFDDLAAAVFDPAADSLAILDATDSGTKKEAWTDIGTAIAGDGLAASSGVLAVDLNELTSAVFDPAADSMSFIDATDSGSKQDSWADIASAIAGSGLTATSGVLSAAAGESLTIQQLTAETITGSDTALAEALAISNPSKIFIMLNGQIGMQDTDVDAADQSMFSVSGTTLTWLASSGCAPDLATDDLLVAFMFD